MDLSPGLMVSSNVRLTRPLGEGAMGCVWLADHLTLRTHVAVKFISAELASDNREILARFVQEASLAAQIRSPHVVQIFDQGVMRDGTPYIVMELLEGESLQSWLDRRGRLSTHEAATVVIHVARALRRAHELGIVHRDIKPDNVFVSQNEDGLFCKVLDFGIAKQTQLPKMGLTNAGVMVGTPEYMSPEQVLSAKDVDFRADLWALAVTHYYMLTGALPFTAEALGTLCVKLLDGKFTPATQLRGDLPPGADAWFLRALAHDPDDRFQSAREMAVAFVRLLAADEGLDDEVSFTGVMPLGGGQDLGPRNKIAASGIDVTAPLLDLTPAPPDLAPTAPLPAMPPLAGTPLDGAQLGPAHSGVEAAKTATLTGSSSNRRADDVSRRPMAAFVGGGVAIGALVAAVVLLARPSGDSASTDPDPSAQGAASPPSAPEDTAEPDRHAADAAAAEEAAAEEAATEDGDDATVSSEGSGGVGAPAASSPTSEKVAPKPRWPVGSKATQPKSPTTADPGDGKPPRYNHGF